LGYAKNCQANVRRVNDDHCCNHEQPGQNSVLGTGLQNEHANGPDGELQQQTEA